jgi:hypothetical protein
MAILWQLTYSYTYLYPYSLSCNTTFLKTVFVQMWSVYLVFFFIIEECEMQLQEMNILLLFQLF